MKKKIMLREIEIPVGVTASYANKIFKAKGKNGELSKSLYYPKVRIEIQPGKVVMTAEKVSKVDKMYFGTIKSHIKNLIKGASENYVYTLKVCSGHFPMTAACSGKKFEVKNYLGEKIPRVLLIKDGATVKVEGDKVTVSANDKELAGQVAADIELLMRISNRDRRIFQDGIFITNKHGKDV